MIVYHFNPITREYAGASEADESPLEPGVFLVPAWSTEIAPERLPAKNEWLVFDGYQWKITNASPTIDPVSPTTETLLDPKEQAKAGLEATDKDMARIAEDLITALISRGVITKQDIPKPAIDKLSNRENLRKALI